MSMPGILDINEGVGTGVTSQYFGVQSQPNFLAFLSGHHSSQSASTTYDWDTGNYALTVPFNNHGASGFPTSDSPFTEASGIFNPKVKGFYCIHSQVCIDNINDAGRVTAWLKDQSGNTVNYVSVHSGKSQALTAVGTIVREFNGIADSVRLQFYFESGASETLLGTDDHSLFCAYRVG